MQSTEKFPLGGTNLNNQESDLLSVSDEQKITAIDKIQAELLAKGLPLTFLFATLATIYKTIFG
ncbi:MAG: hypothetical protein GW942_01240 [Candidatus Pacebacteria bacterium]|nr:hypothetical protein [Candidatus Paceibacterota bacterium]PIS10120.1 MAG: hypothetical protein COT73_11115 [Bdellovibrio sp. CG10_big_fil_rev_8_21_14_0_10_47_8]